MYYVWITYLCNKMSTCWFNYKIGISLNCSLKHSDYIPKKYLVDNFVNKIKFKRRYIKNIVNYQIELEKNFWKTRYL